MYYYSLFSYYLFLLLWNRLLCRIGTDINGSKVGFVRNLVGQAEKWVILKANTSITSPSAGVSTGMGNSKLNTYSGNRRFMGGEEEPNSIGNYVRIGDHVLLQAIPPSSDYIISLHESANGRDIRLQHKDKVRMCTYTLSNYIIRLYRCYLGMITGKLSYMVDLLFHRGTSVHI